MKTQRFLFREATDRKKPDRKKMPPSPVFLVAATVLLMVISLWGVSIALVFLLTRFVSERKKS